MDTDGRSTAVMKLPSIIEGNLLLKSVVIEWMLLIKPEKFKYNSGYCDVYVILCVCVSWTLK